MLVFTKNALQSIDHDSTSVFGIPPLELMEVAAVGAATYIHAQINPSAQKHIKVLCGAGNNGGDGYAVARLLTTMGHWVSIAQVQEPTSPDAITNANRATSVGVSLEPWKQGNLDCDLIVDAIFGTGLSREVQGRSYDIIDAMNSSGTSICALDIPSGMGCDLGIPMGICIRATHTVTFVGMKVGFLNRDAEQYLGKVDIAGIGCPQSLLEKYGTLASEYDG